jgi:hypothetical protein
MEPTDKIDVTLEAQQWNAVIAIMAKSPVPYEVSHQLIQEMQRQCNAMAQTNGNGMTVQRPTPGPDVKLGKKPILDG